MWPDNCKSTVKRDDASPGTEAADSCGSHEEEGVMKRKALLMMGVLAGLSFAVQGGGHNGYLHRQRPIE